MATKLELLLTAVDKVSAPLRRVQQRIEAVTKPVRQVGNALASVSQAAGFPELTAATTNTLSKFAKVGEEAARLGRRLAIGLGAAAFAGYELFTRTVASGDALKKQSARLQTSVDDL